MVVTSRASVARWAGQPVELGGGNQLKPLVLDARGLPWREEEPELAHDSLELALLSLILSAPLLEPARAAQAALLLLRLLSGRQADTMLMDILRVHLPRRARRELDRLMADPTNYQYQSNFARKYVDEGKKLGIDEGKRLGISAAVLEVLEARDLIIPAQARRRIQAEQNTELLETWLVRAATVASADELFVV